MLALSEKPIKPTDYLDSSRGKAAKKSRQPAKPADGI